VVFQVLFQFEASVLVYKSRVREKLASELDGRSIEMSRLMFTRSPGTPILNLTLLMKMIKCLFFGLHSYRYHVNVAESSTTYM
jgi:hypothetical protein